MEVFGFDGGTSYWISCLGRSIGFRTDFVPRTIGNSSSSVWIVFGWAGKLGVDLRKGWPWKILRCVRVVSKQKFIYQLTSKIPDSPLRAERIPKRVIFVKRRRHNLNQLAHETSKPSRSLTVKVPIMNIKSSTAFVFMGSLTLKSKGIGIAMMIRSDDMFKTAFVIRWFVAAEHWAVGDISIRALTRKCLEHTAICWYRPVLIEWSAPHAQIQDFHNNLKHESHIISIEVGVLTNPIATYTAVTITILCCGRRRLIQWLELVRGRTSRKYSRHSSVHQ